MENKVKTEKYSPEDTKMLIALYAKGKGKSVKEIGIEMNRSPRSITGKLVNLGEYVKAEVAPKTYVDTGPTKKDLRKRLEKLGIFTEKDLDGLQNCTKPALTVIAEKLEAAAASSNTNSEPVEQAVEQVA